MFEIEINSPLCLVVSVGTELEPGYSLHLTLEDGSYLEDASLSRRAYVVWV